MGGLELVLKTVILYIGPFTQNLILKYLGHMAQLNQIQ